MTDRISEPPPIETSSLVRAAARYKRITFANAMWGPLAFAIMFGLSFAIILTLVLVPVLFFRAPHPERATVAREE